MRPKEQLRPVAITMGCPAGIGPEIVLRFRAEMAEAGKAVVIGDSNVLERCAAELSLPVKVRNWLPGEAVDGEALNVLHCPSIDAEKLVWGRPDRDTGRAMALYIEEAVRRIQLGELSAMVTCPIAKKTLQEAGYTYPGHTEMLADLCGTKRYAMMMAGETLRVCLATIHVPLRQVPSLLHADDIYDLILLTALALQRDFGVKAARIAVAGLNPHSGESGLFGREEEEIIAPAVRRAREAGIDVSGPLPPDTVFYKAAQEALYDVVLCMYHDQGLIPFKLLHFRDGVNVTLGLPIVRTSVDHGTAYDIAGLGKANYESLAAAFRMAGQIAANRAEALQSGEELDNGKE